MIVVGTAGWSLPRADADQFPCEGTHLARYARVFRGAEINTSFYRSHSQATYARWAASTPRGFRFAVKLPQTITHEKELRASRVPLLRFFDEIEGLGRRLGPLLVQLPPSLALDRRVARSFFSLLRRYHAGPVVCEPRHPSWFTPAGDALLLQHQIARVATDPTGIALAARPGGYERVVYFRLHGSPRRYWSEYSAERVDAWAAQILQLPRGTQAWCIFDNTAGGGAVRNALRMTTQTRR